MLTVKEYIQIRITRMRLLFNIHRYERMIRQAWKRSLTLPYEKRCEVTEKLLYHESNLHKLKALYNEA